MVCRKRKRNSQRNPVVAMTSISSSVTGNNNESADTKKATNTQVSDDNDYTYVYWQQPQMTAAPSISQTSDDNSDMPQPSARTARTDETGGIYYDVLTMHKPHKSDDGAGAATYTPNVTSVINHNRQSIMPQPRDGSMPTTLEPKYTRVNNKKRASLMPQ